MSATSESTINSAPLSTPGITSHAAANRAPEVIIAPATHSAPGPIIASRGLSFDATCGLLALAPIALRVLLMPIPPHDFWWHLAMGRLIAQKGAVPVSDAFSWSRPGQAFFDQSWLSQITFHALHQAGGLAAIVFVQMLLLVFSYAVLLGVMTQNLKSQQFPTRIAALVLGVVTIVSFDNWLVRPQSYAIPLFACFYAVLWAHRTRRAKVLWTLPLLMICWVNTHGSFVLGAGLLVLTLVGESWKARRGEVNALSHAELRTLMLWSATALLAILCNPRGVGVLGYVHMMLFDASNKFSAEWLSPSPRNFGDAAFFALAIAFFAALIYARRKPDVTDWLLCLVFFWLAITSGRYIIWFAFVAAPPLGVALGHISAAGRSVGNGIIQVQRPPSQSTLNGVLVLLVWLMIVPCLPWFKPALGLPPQLSALYSEETPVRAVQALQALPPQKRPRRLFHNAPTGSYMSFAAPEHKVWIDTRFEFYPPQQWRDYLHLSEGVEVDAILGGWKFDGLLLDTVVEKPLLRYALQSGRWRIVHRDSRAVLLLPAP
ncbi:MAG: hypothetical protein JWN98_484 [Abditibacteriota bacterium]|nr:hypothetical protein [Abditibacteriota bacterium]